MFFTDPGIDHNLTAAIAAGACSAISKYAAPAAMLRSLRLMAKSGVPLEPSAFSQTGKEADRDGKIEKMLELLTPRERQIARLVSEGMSNKEIARRLDVSQGTVKVHLHNIFQKLEITNRTVLATISWLQRTSGFGALAAGLSGVRNCRRTQGGGRKQHACAWRWPRSGGPSTPEMRSGRRPFSSISSSRNGRDARVYGEGLACQSSPSDRPCGSNGGAPRGRAIPGLEILERGWCGRIGHEQSSCPSAGGNDRHRDWRRRSPGTSNPAACFQLDVDPRRLLAPSPQSPVR